MSQRFSEYKRQPHDAYQTPPWVTGALIPHLPASVHKVWEPAAGEGGMVRVLRSHGYTVTAGDITEGRDFLNWRGKLPTFDSVATNPTTGHRRSSSVLSN